VVEFTVVPNTRGRYTQGAQDFMVGDGVLVCGEVGVGSNDYGLRSIRRRVIECDEEGDGVVSIRKMVDLRRSCGVELLDEVRNRLESLFHAGALELLLLLDRINCLIVADGSISFGF